MKLDDHKTLRPATSPSLPPQSISEEVLLEKYAKGGEQNVDAVRRRVARALAAVEPPKQREAMGAGVPRRAAQRLHPRRAHQLRRGHRPQGDAHQLLRPAGRRQHLRRRERHRHLRGAERGRRDDAARRRRRLRLLAHPAAGRARPRHEQPRERAAVLHARVRPELRDRRVRRLPPRRADGHPALRPPGHRGVHPREGRRPPHELQPLGGGDRRVRRGGTRQRRVAARAQGTARARPPRGGRAPARRRPVGVPHGARRRAVGPDHAVHVRPRRTGRRVHRRDEPRQQPVVLRDDRGVQSVRHGATPGSRPPRGRARWPTSSAGRSPRWSTARAIPSPAPDSSGRDRSRCSDSPRARGMRCG